MVNTKHDTTSYENCSYEREIFDMNNLYDAFKKSKMGSDWKHQVQSYEMNFLSELAKLSKELNQKTFKFLPTSEFVLSERGKTRLISGEQIHDRIAKGCLCDYELLPLIKKYLIYDNGASLKGKGIGFTRKRFEMHLKKYYQKNGSNDGYILLIDFSKYFDNIRHNDFLEIFKKIGTSDDAMWLLSKTVERSRVDVSYMDEFEYENCLNQLFNSLDHQKIDKSRLTGNRHMPKHLNIGDQVAQVAGICYPLRLDNYIKIVKGIKLYGRYMDDSYIIHEDKEYLRLMLKEIVDVARGIGITINVKKTRICKLSACFKFLQINYSLTDTGRIIKKINPKRIVAMRRKMKKLIYVLPIQEFDNLYKSWISNHYKIMSAKQRESMNELYSALKGERYVQNNA